MVFIYRLTRFRLNSDLMSSRFSDVLPDGCQNLLQSFANETARFTLCVVTNARPITVCEKCVNEFNQVFKRYEEIQKVRKVVKLT